MVRRVQIDSELRGVYRTATAAVELGTLLDQQRHLMDVTLNASGGLQRY
jgi:hypothetical protein